MGMKDFMKVVTLYAIKDNELVPVAVDSDGKIISAIQGAYLGTLKTVAVDADGNIIAKIMGWDGSTSIPILVDASGAMISRIYGWDGSNFQLISVNASGEMITRIKGLSGNYADFDAEGALKVNPFGTYGAITIQQPLLFGYKYGANELLSTNLTGTNQNTTLQTSAVLAGRLRTVNYISVWYNTSRVRKMGFWIQSGSSVKWIKKIYSGIFEGVYSFIGDLLLVAGEYVKAEFTGSDGTGAVYIHVHAHEMDIT